MTKKELEAENERLGKEVAALRTLLAAARECADVPMPAGDDDGDWRAFLSTSSRRADLVAVYANPDVDGAVHDVLLSALHDRAQSLRTEAARPLRYTPKTAAPAVEAWRLTPKGIEAAKQEVNGLGVHLAVCGRHAAMDAAGRCDHCDEGKPEGGVLLPAAVDPDNAPAACSDHGGTAEPTACWECQGVKAPQAAGQ